MAFAKPNLRISDLFQGVLVLLFAEGLASTVDFSLFMGIIMLARATGVQMAERPHEQLVGAPPDYHQKTLIAQFG